MTTGIKILITVVWGLALGIITPNLSKRLALKRTDDPARVAPLGGKWAYLIACVCGMGAVAGLVFTAQSTAAASDVEAYPLLVRNLLLLVPIFSIAFVDAIVRKIPNPLLLFMIVVDIAYLAYACITAKSAELLIKAGIGIFIGALVCYVPSLFKIPMGAGDIKYNAVIGLCLYASGYVFAMVVMTLVSLIIWVYLKITKKGNMKTQVPMGPALSIGVIVSMCMSLFSFIDELI